MRYSKWLRWKLILVLALAPALGQAQEPGDVRKDLADMEKRVQSSFEAAQKDIDALKADVARLRKELEALRKQRGGIRQEARLGPVPASSIRLINSYVTPMSIIVNGTRYPLEPGETRILRGQLPGRFTYEIPGVKEPTERTLDANETFTIRIFVP